MNIEPIIQSPYKINFGIYKGTHKTYYGYMDNGIYKNKNIDIYTAFNNDGSLKHKLYYVTDLARNWIKSKLKFFRGNKCYYIARSESQCKK